jgi:outer membrane protein OmpA-like peptidoglycan-associated protein
MNRKIYLGLVFLAFIALVIYGRYEFVCNMLGMCGNSSSKTSPIVEDDGRGKDLTFSMGKSPVLNGYDQFVFPRMSASSVFNTNNSEFLTKVLNYLNENQDMDLKITGYYTTAEKDTTFGIFENLGLARAGAIRDWFEVRNMDIRRITITSALDDNALQRPISFEGIAKQANVPDEYDNESVPRYTFEDMTFQFAYDSDKFVPNDAFKTYAEEVKAYLSKEENSNKTVLIVGYTCDMGKEMYNYNLGKSRAENAKAYFVNKAGISKSKIFTDSRGMSKPIVPNDNNEENRKQNRRVNIQIVD